MCIDVWRFYLPVLCVCGRNEKQTHAANLCAVFRAVFKLVVNKLRVIGWKSFYWMMSTNQIFRTVYYSSMSKVNSTRTARRTMKICWLCLLCSACRLVSNKSPGISSWQGHIICRKDLRQRRLIKEAFRWTMKVGRKHSTQVMQFKIASHSSRQTYQTNQQNHDQAFQILHITNLCIIEQGIEVRYTYNPIYNWTNMSWKCE